MERQGEVIPSLTELYNKRGEHERKERGLASMKTLAIINQKGGVGKSTTALAVGAYMKLKGARVLFIDLDPQGNLSFVLGADTEEGQHAMGVLQAPETASAQIQKMRQGDLLASTPSLAMANVVLTAHGKEHRLREALTPLKRMYDYCIIDTPPALGVLTTNALTACRGVVIPAQADVFSLQGIGQLNETIRAVRAHSNPLLKVLGIALTRFNKRTIISREIAEALETTAETLNTKLYKSRIRECTALKEAQAMRKSIFEYAPKSNAAKDYSALAIEIMED